MNHIVYLGCTTWRLRTQKRLQCNAPSLQQSRLLLIDNRHSQYTREFRCPPPQQQLQEQTMGCQLAQSDFGHKGP